MSYNHHFNLIIFILTKVTFAGASPSTKFPMFYLGGPHTKICSLDSPESFYWKVALPTLQILNEEAHGFFGILMDKLDETTSDLDPEEEEKLEKQWLYIMETIQDSLENTATSIKKSWAIFVAVSETFPLPWEASVKGPMLKELLTEIEYQYMMFGAVVKGGVKEIVSTLQQRVTKVIKQLEKHVAEMTAEGEEITELNLLNKMEQSFQNMDSDFVSRLMRRIVRKSIGGRIPNAISPTPVMKVFFSKTMEDIAIVFQAFRERGHVYKHFWAEIGNLVKAEMDSNPRDLSSFLHHFNTNNELFVENVFAILVSRFGKD